MTPDLPSFLVGLATGGVILGLALRETINVLREQLDQARRAEAVATDRLVHAWKEGATIPPRPVEQAPPPDPLPESLQQELDSWEDGEHRAHLESLMRAGLQEGKSAVAILMQLDNIHP